MIFNIKYDEIRIKLHSSKARVCSNKSSSSAKRTRLQISLSAKKIIKDYKIGESRKILFNSSLKLRKRLELTFYNLTSYKIKYRNTGSKDTNNNLHDSKIYL